MKAKKYKHLSFEDRCVIEEFLNNNSPFELAYLFLGEQNIKKFNIKKIDNDDIDLSIRLLKK